MARTVHTHYDNLSVSRDAPPDVVTASFKALLEKYDPAKYSDSAEALRIVAVLHVSHNALMTPATRAAHDAWIAASESALALNEAATRGASANELSAPSTQSLFTRSQAADRPAVMSGVRSTGPSRGESQPAALAQSSGFAGWLTAALVLLFVVVVVTLVKCSAPMPPASEQPRKVSAPPVAAPKVAKVAPPSAVVAPATTPTPPVIAAPIAFLPDMAVAATNANLRDGASVKSKIVRTLSRSTPVKFIQSEGTFTGVVLADGTTGWIAEDLLIAHSSLARLQNTTAAAYASGPEAEKRFRTTSSRVQPLIDRYFPGINSRIRAPDAALLQHLAAFAAEPHDMQTADADAARWYTLSGQQAKNEGNNAIALANFVAATVADPDNAANHVAVGLTAFELGESPLVLGSAARAVPLAPMATNSWLVMALSMVNTPSDHPTAKGAFLLAIKLSRDPEYTRKYLRNLAAKGNNPQASTVINAALFEDATNKRLFQ